MRSTTQLLVVSLVLAGLSSITAAGQTAWYYHVKTGGTGGKPVQGNLDPGLSSCWNSINAAFAAVKSRATPGPWIIQVDDEATYDESVNLFDFQTSSTETLTLTKAPWLVGRPTIYPTQPKKRALLINGLPPGRGEPLPGQPGQSARRVTYLTIRGFTLKNNAQGTDLTRDQPVISDTQTYLTEGLHMIEDCDFDGQDQVYDCRIAVFVNGTCINTVFRGNVFHHFKMREDPADKMFGYVFVMTEPVATVVGQPQVTIADNKFYANQGLAWECMGDAVNKRYYRVVFERNTLTNNSSAFHSMAVITDNSLTNIVRNNLFFENRGPDSHGTFSIWNASNTRIYHNTFVNNHTGRELAVSGYSDGVEIKNNLFWPTPGGHFCIDVQPGYKGNLICANNAFFTDWKNDGYPPGSTFSTTENTEIIGFWKDVPMTTSAWNNAAKKTSGLWSFFRSASMNNTGNGYTLGGPGLDKNGRLIAGSLCLDRGVQGLVSEDIDGGPRPEGGGYDIGAVEYRIPAKASRNSQ
jgi:hypothetical protein